MNGWSAIYWSMRSLSGTASFKETNSPHPAATQLPRTPQLGAGHPSPCLRFCLTWSCKGLVQAVTCHTFWHFMYATALCTENRTSRELLQLRALRLFSALASWCCLSLGRRGWHPFLLALSRSIHCHSLLRNGRREERAGRMKSRKVGGDVSSSGNRRPAKPRPYNSCDCLKLTYRSLGHDQTVIEWGGCHISLVLH